MLRVPSKSELFQDTASSDDNELHIHYHLNNNVNDANVQMDQRPQSTPGGHQGYGSQQQQQQQPQGNPAIAGLAVVQPIIQQA